MYFLEQEGEEIIIYDDDPPATKKLKMQMRENREKVRRAKAKKAAQEKSDLKFSDLLEDPENSDYAHSRIQKIFFSP